MAATDLLQVDEMPFSLDGQWGWTAEQTNRYESAAELFKSRRYAEALAILDEGAEEDCERGELVYARARCLYKVNRHAEALAQCDWLERELHDPRGRALRAKIRACQPDSCSPDVEAMVQEAADKMARAETLRADLQAALAQTQAERTALQTALEEMALAKERAAATERALSADLELARGNAAASDNALGAVRAEREALASTLAQCRAQRDEAQDETMQAQSDAQAARQEAEIAQRALGERETDHAAAVYLLEQRLQQTQADLELARTELEASQRALDEQARNHDAAVREWELCFRKTQAELEHARAEWAILREAPPHPLPPGKRPAARRVWGALAVALATGAGVAIGLRADVRATAFIQPRALPEIMPGPTLPPVADFMLLSPEHRAAAQEEKTKPGLAAAVNAVAALRQDVTRLSSSIETLGGGVRTRLERENADLRGQIRGHHARLAVPPVPVPDKQLPEDVLNQAPTAKTPAARQTFTSIAEWGRTPGEAAQMNPPAASLKGMIGVVDSGTDDETLVALGRRLHRQYADCDNINIEVFDDEKEARAFGDGKPARRHRVLSVSKHRGSNRNTILLIRGEDVREIAP